MEDYPSTNKQTVRNHNIHPNFSISKDIKGNVKTSKIANVLPAKTVR